MNNQKYIVECKNFEEKKALESFRLIWREHGIPIYRILDDFDFDKWEKEKQEKKS